MCKIFLLEDDKELKESIEEVLDLQGFEIESFFDGEKACSGVEDKNFDLYIIDINVPKYNGIDVMKYIKGIKYIQKF